MRIKSHIRSVRLIFAGIMLILFTGLTGCGREEAEFLEKELVQEESTETSTGDVEQEALKDTEGGEPGEKSSDVQKSSTRDGSAEPEESDAQSGSGDGGKQPAVDPQNIYVDVCGAVTSPGVYELPSGSRVFQAIEKAGGYLPEAAVSYLNRAKGLSDGQQIYVPTQDEVDSQRIAATEDGTEPSSGSSTDSGTRQESTGAAGDGTASGTGQKINLNTADVSQLTTLTGVGESKALAIIAYREENGPFASVEDIMNVPGIKEGTYEKIKDKIAIE